MATQSLPARVVSIPASRPAPAQSLTIDLGVLGKPLIVTFGVGLVVMSLLGTLVVVLRDVYGLNTGEFGRLFDLDAEQNVSTWFQVVQLYCAGLLGGLVAFSRYRVGDARWIYWTGIALLLALFSADELAGFHERLAAFVSWIRVAKYFLIAVGLLYLRFWWSMPARFRVLMVVACVVYFGSALGLEIFAFKFWSPDPTHRLTYAVISIFEETGEMIGALLFVSTLLAYLRHTGVELQMRLTR